MARYERAAKPEDPWQEQKQKQKQEEKEKEKEKERDRERPAKREGEMEGRRTGRPECQGEEVAAAAAARGRESISLKSGYRAC